MPMPMVMPTVTAIPKTTPSTRSSWPRPAAPPSTTDVDDSLTVSMRRARHHSVNTAARPEAAGSLPAEDLPQVVLEVADVVAHEVFERRRLALADLDPADLVEVVAVAAGESRR